MPTTFALIAILLYLSVSAVLAARLRPGSAAARPRPLGRAPLLGVWALAVVLHAMHYLRGRLHRDGHRHGILQRPVPVRMAHCPAVVGGQSALPAGNSGHYPAAFRVPCPGHGTGVQRAGYGHGPAPGLQIHILLSLLAYSLLAIAAIQSILLAIQNHHLHHHHPGGFIRALPPLAIMEGLLFQIIGLGFVFLSASLISGFMFLEDLFGQQVAHKTLLAIAAWGLFAALLLGRWRFGWRGRIAIRWTLGGFFALALAYFGSKLVLELILGR
jgi:hypothetical protein